MDADDQTATGRQHVFQEMRQQLRPEWRWHVLQAGADEIEPTVRHPVQSVADDDAIGPVWESLTRQRGKLRQDFEAVRVDGDAVFGQPLHRALQQEAVGAADVKEGAVAADGSELKAAGALPLRG